MANGVAEVWHRVSSNVDGANPNRGFKWMLDSFMEEEERRVKTGSQEMPCDGQPVSACSDCLS